MVEQDQPNPLEDPGFYRLMEDIEQHLKTERQLKNSVIWQYIASNLATNIDPQDEEKSAQRLRFLFPQWRDWSIKLETDEKKKKILESLTLKEVALFCTQEHERYSKRMVETTKEQLELWSKLVNITKKAAELEHKPNDSNL